VGAIQNGQRHRRGRLSDRELSTREPSAFRTGITRAQDAQTYAPSRQPSAATVFLVAFNLSARGLLQFSVAVLPAFPEVQSHVEVKHLAVVQGRRALDSAIHKAPESLSEVGRSAKARRELFAGLEKLTFCDLEP
jgi:hypothetical protein